MKQIRTQKNPDPDLRNAKPDTFNIFTDVMGRAEASPRQGYCTSKSRMIGTYQTMSIPFLCPTGTVERALNGRKKRGKEGSGPYLQAYIYTQRKSVLLHSTYSYVGMA